MLKRQEKLIMLILNQLFLPGGEGEGQFCCKGHMLAYITLLTGLLHLLPKDVGWPS